MSKVTRLGDIGSGHACHFPATPATSASPDVYVNGIKVVRQGDAYAPHGCAPCPQPPHPRSMAGGSASVFVNGRPIARLGDGISCGGEAAEASPNVYAGD